MEKQIKQFKIRVTLFGRLLSSILTILEVIGFLIFLGTQFFFLQDQPLTDRLHNIHSLQAPGYHLCFLKYTKFICHIPIPPPSKSLQWFDLMNQIGNLLPFTLFWFHHIFFSNLKMKNAIIRIFPSYIFIERALFNLTAEAMVIFSYNQWNYSSKLIFQFPPHFFYLVIGLSMLGTIMTVWAILDMDQQADLFGVRFMASLWNKDEVDYFERYEPKDKGKIIITKLYSIMRHPMQAGFILQFVFSGMIYSLDRFLFVVVMLSGIVAGVLQEEKQLERLFPSYVAYKKQVKYRFIPNLSKLFESKEVKNE